MGMTYPGVGDTVETGEITDRSVTSPKLASYLDALPDTEGITEAVISIFLTNNTGGTVTQFTPVGPHATTGIVKSSAANVLTNPSIGLVTEDVLDGAGARVSPSGMARKNSWTWTPMAKLYISDTAGALSEGPPATGSRLPVAVALTANTILYNFDPTKLPIT